MRSPSGYYTAKMEYRENSTGHRPLGDSLVHGKRILLIIGGGIAAYKCLELIRLIRKAGGSVTPVLTRAAAEFVTPLSVAALESQNGLAAAAGLLQIL